MFRSRTHRTARVRSHRPFLQVRFEDARVDAELQAIVERRTSG